MKISDLLSIITAVCVIGTTLHGFISLYSLRKSEQDARQYNLKSTDYEKRRDFILTNLAEYIQLLDAHELSFMAITDEEYEGKDLETHKKLYALETVYYKIKLMINTDNLCSEEFSTVLDKSMSLAREITTENSFAEFLSNGLRTPERALEISDKALALKKKAVDMNTDKATVKLDVESADKERLGLISEAVKYRDSHIKNYLSAVEELSTQKEMLVATSQKYLIAEKKQLLKEGTK